MERDKDYLVKDDQILIIDHNTGRVMEGRRFSDGLHQAIEAKEHVPIKPENRTVASITYQSLFNKYDKCSGMTGTGRAEAAEFRETYHMDIVAIPTNKPVARKDHDDIIYRTRAEKLEAICDQVSESHTVHRPVLVGTTSVAASEELDELLCRHHIPHHTLNAKNHEKEAAIVAEAGKRDAVTIATNMAGRGTDIKLDEDARAAGGLLVIGSERHESSRIDGQLRGRSGRQGDPGESQFYLSLEDELLRLFGNKRLESAFDAARAQTGVGLSNAMLTKAIEQAQRQIEGVHFEQRKQLRKFDEVIDKQREVIYTQRRQILETDDIRSIVEAFIDTVVADAFMLAQVKVEAKAQTVRAHGEDENAHATWANHGAHAVHAAHASHAAHAADDPDGMIAPDEAEASFARAVIEPFENILSAQQRAFLLRLEEDELEDRLIDELDKLYNDIEESFSDQDFLHERARLLILESVDDHWADHVDNLDQLRLGIGLVSYANLDPVTEYQRKAAELFECMCRAVRIDVVATLLETTKHFSAKESTVSAKHAR